MLLLEWSDTRVRFKIREIENNIAYDMDYTDYTKYLLEIKFSDESILEVQGTVDNDTQTVYFDIFWERTDGKEWSLTADIRGTNWVKKVRFNPTTIKGKVLNSVKIPDVSV